jgi:inner membrane protein YidH
MADNEVMKFEGDVPPGTRSPRAVFDAGGEPDPLYTLANERTYLAWLRLSVTLLAAAVAVDRLFLERPRNGSEVIALGLVSIAVGACGLGVRRWWVTERALRLRRPLPGFGAPLLGVLAVLLVGAGTVFLIATPRG